MELQVRPLGEPVLPEPPRNGEAGPEGCEGCVPADRDFLWTEEHWRLKGVHGSLPAILMPIPRGHHTLLDLPAERAAELGGMAQRIERTIRTLGGIGRVHVSEIGDGGTHLYLFLTARPEGMLQLRGSCLPLPDEVWAESARRIAEAMAKDGGTAHV
ncbi:hypothetical protein [Streptomyces sp. NPDC006463]|uniref:hypothetical protein n=1 Tax=Streptomyces sp. NPDC006463 TaxID=3364746 RepID=UPI0036C0B358